MRALSLAVSCLLFPSTHGWVWTCGSNGLCSRLQDSADGVSTLELCRSTCGKYKGLFPLPTGATNISSNLAKFDKSAIELVLPSDAAVKTFLINITNLVLDNLPDTPCVDTNSVTISIAITDPSLALNLNTAEDSTITIATQTPKTQVQISASTVFGARHALETLLQLIELDGTCLVIPDTAQIADRPVYAYRGFLLDTARNFVSIPVIKQHLDAMAASKLNVLHWHITDSQSIPLDLVTLPNVTKFGAYSPRHVFHPEQVLEVIAYAKLRGIRILLEFDAPAHAGNGWQWGPDAGLGDLAVCINQQPWRSYCIEPPCGQLNPVNDNIYKLLRVLYTELAKYITDDFFHMGGDELFIPCWNTTPQILDYLGDKPRTTDTFVDLWSEFQGKNLGAFDSALGRQNTSLVLWSSHLTDPAVIAKYLASDRYVVQTWVPSTDTLPAELLKLGYRIIESTKDAWYLDHGFFSVTTYHNWQTVYNNKINTGTGTLGGEVCMWGEFIDDIGTIIRAWPRAAAAAERLWSNPTTTANTASPRFYRHRERLVARGVPAAIVTPYWCYQNEGRCL